MRRWVGARRRALGALAALALAAASAAAAPPPAAAPETGRPAGFFDRHAEGWFWYQDPPPEPEQPEETPEPPAPQAAARPAPATPALPADDPREALRRLREQLEIAQARAVMDPTPESLRAFLELNLAVHKRAERFANVWQQVLWTHPELDPRTERPAAQAALHAWRDRLAEVVKARLRQAARRWGIWYFYESTCPFCKAQAPVLKRFAAEHGFHVMAIALDGVPVPEFPDARPDTRGWAERLGVRTVPAFFLVDPRRRRVVPVGAGYMAPSELAERIYTVLEGHPPGTPPDRGAGPVREASL